MVRNKGRHLAENFPEHALQLFETLRADAGNPVDDDDVVDAVRLFGPLPEQVRHEGGVIDIVDEVLRVAEVGLFVVILLVPGLALGLGIAVVVFGVGSGGAFSGQVSFNRHF